MKKKLLAVACGFAAAGIMVGFYTYAFVIYRPPTVAAASTAPGSANVVLQTVPTYGSDPTPDWVSYFERNSQGQWVHSTFFSVPAHSTINVTIYQFDSASGLRNPLWAQARGTVGGTMTVNGKTTDEINNGDAAHSFAIPDLGVSVPLRGDLGHRHQSLPRRPLRQLLMTTTPSPSASPPAPPVSTAGSASSPVPPASTRASAGRCRPSATWTGRCTSSDDPVVASRPRDPPTPDHLGRRQRHRAHPSSISSSDPICLPSR